MAVCCENDSENIYESNQQDATIQGNLLFLVSSTCFGRCLRPSPEVLDELKLSFNSSKTPAGSYLGEYYQIL